MRIINKGAVKKMMLMKVSGLLMFQRFISLNVWWYANLVTEFKTC